MGILVNFNYQLDSLQSPTKEVSAEGWAWPDWPVSISVRMACALAPPSVGGSIPYSRDPGLHNKTSEVWPWSKPESSIPPQVLLQGPAWVPVLMSINNGLWPRSVRQINPFFPQAASGQAVLSQQQKAERHFSICLNNRKSTRMSSYYPFESLPDLSRHETCCISQYLVCLIKGSFLRNLFEMKLLGAGKKREVYYQVF